MKRQADGRPMQGSSSLRELAGCGGCAAKAPPQLVAMLAGLLAPAKMQDPALLVGLAPADDAAVYALDAERGLIATVDFFPPLVDDPHDYGVVAAANAVSDVYAMGGTVAFALALCGFPATVADEKIAAVLRGAAATVVGCGGSIVGGHTIRCAEPVFGLCVLGFVHPQRIWRKCGAQPGDVLMLSKAIGTGLLLSAGDQAGLEAALHSMRATNRGAANALMELTTAPHAVTDISGFGLVGHVAEMASQSDVGVTIRAAAVPVLPGAYAAAARGVRTSVHGNLATSNLGLVRVDDVDAPLRAVLEDPQTSGGLLAAVSPDSVAALGALGFVEIGSVHEGPGSVLIV
ncbi:MAG TPA: selenide, water dikinase SelD [Steroidobacteraceae bacterium]|nr:selenide, water dikinase SelD [Steroidobacteraceae bacterium]HRX88265.1 selenide, water dikinase SelD [Steroidobacteraceae bacterium]